MSLLKNTKLVAVETESDSLLKYQLEATCTVEAITCDKHEGYFPAVAVGERGGHVADKLCIRDASTKAWVYSDASVYAGGRIEGDSRISNSMVAPGLGDSFFVKRSNVWNTYLYGEGVMTNSTCATAIIYGSRVDRSYLLRVVVANNVIIDNCHIERTVIPGIVIPMGTTIGVGVSSPLYMAPKYRGLRLSNGVIRDNALRVFFNVGPKQATLAVYPGKWADKEELELLYTFEHDFGLFTQFEAFANGRYGNAEYQAYCKAIRLFFQDLEMKK